MSNGRRAQGPFMRIKVKERRVTIDAAYQNTYTSSKGYQDIAAKDKDEKSGSEDDNGKDLVCKYCKTHIVRVPFISQILRPWQPRENNGSLI